ncbi:MAG: CHAT domain-containing protein [Bacteroidales bacterium]|nr:CHAT domain-containing protein [Bacteroidales bacterium]
MKIFLITYFLILTASNAIGISPDTTYVKNVYDRAWWYIDIGENQKAIPLLEEILRIKKDDSLDFKPKFFKLYNTLGVLYRRQGSITAAIECYSKALEAESDKNSKAIVYNNLGGLYALQGEYNKAISYNNFALSELEDNSQKENIQRIVYIYHNLGLAYYKISQWEKSLSYYLKSLQLAKEFNVKDVGDTYYNVGLVYQKLGRLSEANHYHLLSIQCYTSGYGLQHYKMAVSYINYAQYLLVINDLAKSWEYYTKAYQVLSQTVGLKHSYTSTCLMDMGNYCYASKDYRRALSYYQQSLAAKVYPFNDTSILANPKSEVFPDIKLIEILKAKAQALVTYSKQLHSTDYLVSALETYQLTAGYIEKLRMGYSYESSKLQISSHEHEVFTAIVTIAYQLYQQTNDVGYKALAFEFAERGKYGVLRQLQSENMARSRADIPDSVTSRELRIKERISSLQYTINEESKQERPSTDKLEKLNAELFSLVRESEQLMVDLESSYPTYYKQKYNNQVVSIPQLQKAMSKSEAVLEYVMSDKELYTFAITRDTFLLLKQETDSIFRSKLDFFIYALHSGYSTDYRDYKDAAYTLYSKLVLPVEHLLKGKNLLIIPDGKLGLTPFEAFTDTPYRDNDRCNYGTELYLLRKYPIGYAYSATLYSNSLNNDYKGSPNFLGVAPDYKNSRDSLKSIPRGMRSVRKLALLTQGKSLTGSNATEANFKKYCNRYGIVHFYAHGLEDTLNPANSKLALSTPTDSTDDGYLYAWEVYNMQMNAQMVVLGSCYSGSGRLLEGEGVLSISRSFMYAGSQSVVMSLWAAADRSTNDILNNYYMNLLKGMRKDEALRQAKLKYLTTDDPVDTHPRYWAGIAVSGNQNALYRYWILKKVILVASIIMTLIILVWKRRTIRGLLSGVVK